MKGYNLIGRYEYNKLPKENRAKILRNVQAKARSLRNKKKWVVITENKSEHYFSLYVKKD